MNNKWSQSGSSFYVGDSTNQKDKLEVGIYSLESDPRTGALYLERLSDKFEFGYKMYGIQEKFINRVLITYQGTKGNLGILLNGVKGTGKSVTAKVLSNELSMPVILVNKGYRGVADFINNIQQEVLVFVDEYEKVFKSNEYSDDSSSLLTVMDGVLENGYRRVFLLTTNHLKVNENLLDRPGRIRYLKTYGDLDKDTIEMIVDDLLQYREHREATIKFISMLQLITVDIVKAVVTEVNIHNEDPNSFKDVFNVTKKEDTYKAYLISKDPEGHDKYLRTFTQDSIDNILDDPENCYQNITIKNRTFAIRAARQEEDLIFLTAIRDSGYDPQTGTYITVEETIRLEKVVSYHSSYQSMFF